MILTNNSNTSAFFMVRLAGGKKKPFLHNLLKFVTWVKYFYEVHSKFSKKTLIQSHHRIKLNQISSK